MGAGSQLGTLGRLMKYFVLLFLNAFDGIATCLGMRLGYLSEDNPIMALLSPIGIVSVKLTLVSLCIMCLYGTRKHHVSQCGAWVCVGVYVHIFILHAQWIGAVL